MIKTALQKQIQTQSTLRRNFGLFDILARKAEAKIKKAAWRPMEQYIRTPDDTNLHKYVNQKPSIYLKDGPAYFIKEVKYPIICQIPLAYPVFCSALIANLHTISGNKDSKFSSVTSKAKEIYHYYDFSNVLSQIISRLRQEYDQNWDRNYEHLSLQLAYVYCGLIPAYRSEVREYMNGECTINELPILSEYDLYHNLSAEECIKKTLQMQEIFHIYYSRRGYGFKPRMELVLSPLEYVQALEQRKKGEVPTHDPIYHDFMQRPLAARCETALEISKRLAEEQWRNAEIFTIERQLKFK